MKRRPRSRRQAQFFIITAVLISGALLFITSMFTSTADIDYTSVLKQHDTDIVENVAHRVQEAWWDTRWLHRTSITVKERSGQYIENHTISTVLPATRRQVNNDCSDIRVVDDGTVIPSNATTGCDIEIYSSESTAVARFKTDESHGQWVNDSTRHGHHAKRGGSLATQSADPDWAPGRYEWGLFFDGSDDFAGTAQFFSSPPAATYTYWAYFPDTSQEEWARTIQTGTRSATPGNGISHEVNPGGAGNDIVRIVHWAGGSASVIGDVGVELNQWNHIAHTTAGGSAKVYVNGEEVLSGSGTRGIRSPPVTMGAGDGNYWQGRLDDVRVYNRTLSADQVKGIYQNGIGLNISVDLAPAEQKTLHVYHGNLFANITQYNKSAFQHRSLPRQPEVVKVDPTRSQTEILTNIRHGVQQLDDRISPNIGITTGPNGCAQITFRSPNSQLRREVC